MADLLHFYPRVVQVYSPRVILVYEGDNDLAQGTPVTVVLDRYRQFLERVQRDLPETPVVLLAVKPSPQRLHLLEAQRAVNAGLLRFATDRSKVIYADTASPILGPDGEPNPRLFLPDRLHLNSLGYDQWRPVLHAAIRQAMGAPTRPLTE